MKNMNRFLKLSFFILLSGVIACADGRGKSSLPLPYPVETEPEQLYEQFRDPDNSARMFVRWWWNGNRVDEREILRELDALKAVGIGGVEINPVAFPHEAWDTLGKEQIPWLSERWLKMVEVAAKGAKERGMYCDMIVGSGWPFGGEFLTRDEQIKMLALETREFTGPAQVTVEVEEIIASAQPEIHSKHDDKLVELTNIRLVPYDMEEFTPGEEIRFDKNAGQIVLDIPEGRHVAYFTVKMTGYMAVIHGSLGSRGPVLDHYNAEAVKLFLNKMSDALKGVFGRIGDYIRSFFTDSLELEGANWCDDFPQEFQKRRGYALEPYLPFVLRKVGHMGDEIEGAYGAKLSPKAREIVSRVRYDFEITLTELFKERFMDVMIDWCHENGVKARMQAYGRGYVHTESTLEVDIPECETWLWKENGVSLPPSLSGFGRGFSMSNKFVSSGANLGGNRIVSCEENTNTAMAFNATLEKLKITGDLSNLSGVSHSIIHGFSYSPPEAPYPGWVRYGTYFNERNTLWKFFPLWCDYKARLSTVFLNSDVQAHIALMHPIADLWSYHQTQRDPFPKMALPGYAHFLWEAVNQNGSGCDYLSEGILRASRFEKGQIRYGERAYKALLLMEVETIAPETLDAIESYARAGGKVIFIGKQPSKAPGLNGMGETGASVASRTAALKKAYPKTVVTVPAPEYDNLFGWYKNLQERFELTPYVSIEQPGRFMSQIYRKAGDMDLFFFANYNLKETFSSPVSFHADMAGRGIWEWDPETGEKRLLALGTDALELDLGPAETKLIVLDKAPAGAAIVSPKRLPSVSREITPRWQITLNHYDGSVQQLKTDTLFNLCGNDKYRGFAGQIVYETNITLSNPCPYMEFDIPNGVSELYVNGKQAGTKWYGRHLYEVGDYIQKGDNTIKIVVTTTLGNYTKSLTDNPIAQVWMRGQDYYPMGMLCFKVYE